MKTTICAFSLTSILATSMTSAWAETVFSSDKDGEMAPQWSYNAASAPVTLSNGSGDGSLQITVDGYGSFGSSTPAGDAYYNPVGPLDSAGTVYESGLFFSPMQNFLTTDSFGAALPPVDFSYMNDTELRSKFNSANYNFELTQYLAPKQHR